MKKPIFKTAVSLFLCLFLLSCRTSQGIGVKENTNNNISWGTTTVYNYELNAQLEVTKLEAKKLQKTNPADNTLPPGDTLPLKSGPIKELPWANEEAFLKAQRETGAKVLLGAYRTVLKDPLPGEEYNVHLAASTLAGTIVKPGRVFSQNTSVGPYTEYKGYKKGPTYIGSKLTTTIGGGVCKIASTLYNVTVLSNLEVVERHYHSMPVPYVPYGQDATVAYGAKDFKFRNNTGGPVLIWAKGIDNILYMAFYGVEEPPRIEWHHEVLEWYKAPRHYRTNDSLQQGQEKVILEGMDGASVRSWITIHQKDGSQSTRKMNSSYYSPMPWLIERGG